MVNTCINGDVRDVLPTLPAESVQMCVTSPPYWGLRDYGVDGQLGLEKTPEEYVEKMVGVFREVRRMLKNDGTIWVNLGDSYVSGQGGRQSACGELPPVIRRDRPAPKARPELENAPAGWAERAVTPRTYPGRDSGLKPKDLYGMPWRVAFALQQPYYTGDIKDERDRIWLAAMIDGEGCIFIHKRKAGRDNGQGYKAKKDSYGSGLEVSNTSRRIPERCLEITGKGSICTQESGRFGRKQTLYRWNLRSNECRNVLREIYPHLVAKQHEARLSIGCPIDGIKAEQAHASLIALHNGDDSCIDFPAPESMFQPGFYLRQDVIWHKLNPMPESVTDRCTKAHEYIFLLSKSARYWFDAEAIKEPLSPKTLTVNTTPTKGSGKESTGEKLNKWMSENGGRYHPEKANKRSVWTVNSQPFAEAHFATFPEKLIEPCILAGSRPGDVVLDPFFGSGTTGQVCERLGRKWLGIELNPEYIEIAKRRTSQIGLGL